MSEDKILVADDVSDSGLQPLRDAGIAVEKRVGLHPHELHEALAGCTGLVVRSETKVTAELLEGAQGLRVIGRAGVGVDNIDVAAATVRGIVVMNAPDGNTITTAEHTIALIVSLARSIPQANSSLKAGHWERKKFIGVELQGKTLGVIGLGRIGRVVAGRARALGMTIVAYDPFIAPDQAPEIELAPLEEVYSRADFLTVHTPLTNETRGLIDREVLAKMKHGARIINCARGGLIDETALYDAIKSGAIAGAAIDVFSQEPPPADHPLLSLEEVIVTPHLGASTTEAQEGVAFTVAEQMRDFLLNGALRGAVNVPSLTSKEWIALQPYIELAATLGHFQAQLIEGSVKLVRLEYSGAIVDYDAVAVSSSFLAGLLSKMSARVNAINAMAIREERGIKLVTSYVRGSDAAPAIRTQVTSEHGDQTAAGTLFRIIGGGREGRITEIDGIPVEAVASGYLLITHSIDVPGVIGSIGSCLGSSGINISNFHLGRRNAGGEAIAVIQTDAPISDSAFGEVLKLNHVLSAKRVELGA